MKPAANVLIEAEYFDDLGGWMVDTEFIQSMGSPYVMAHGLGRPVADAVTTVCLPATGPWRVWVRTLDWVARWETPGTPGRFQLCVDGRPCRTDFGTAGADWHWQDGGVVEIERPDTKLALHDLTGFNGRCDAICFIRDLAAGPPSNDSHILAPWRREALSRDGEIGSESFELVVAGGGYAGMCAALAAARAGLRVALIQDRPVLGGNASSEIRVPLRGLIPEAGPHPGVGALLGELQYDADPDCRHPGPHDDARYERILGAEANLSIFLNHCLFDAETDGDRIRHVKALDVETGVCKVFAGRLFADCTGHGTLGGLAGADFMIGVDRGPDFRPSRENPLMGLTNMWFWEMAETPQPFPETPWALDVSLEDIPAENLKWSWSWESGFYRHPIDDLEAIRDWNLRALFGVWGAMKNAPDGTYANAQITHLAAVGGPRESRRLVGDTTLHEDDMLDRSTFDDGFVPVSWFLDRHFPAAGSLRRYPDEPFLGRGRHKPGTSREARPRHADPWWGIPYRCLYSRSLDNLFMAGRNISTSYWALGAVRVMRTCAMMGEVVGVAAGICSERDCSPRDVYDRHLSQLKQHLGD